MAWSNHNSLHANEKYCTYRARARRHMKRRGYWVGLSASFKFHFFFFIQVPWFYWTASKLFIILLMLVFCLLCCTDSDALCRLCCRRECVANHCATEHLRLVRKCIFFVEWWCYILCSKINFSELIWLTVSETTGRRSDCNSFSGTPQDWFWKLLFLSPWYNQSKLILIEP